jgi:hypothetical protein
MAKFVSLKTIYDARQNVIDTIISKHAVVLFGTPPKSTDKGKLISATPPDMSLITKLFKHS